ncbi:MAG: WcaF family extracellular polysaccharide biosynthesis acetyltransferase [Planctomycetaceae bacterium]|jgi:putative colanic acid biosynthesis acetyltransferase WcaF|nr:WcaF family extracellular polysaccharide biosynthesis acetyltransferase [Planctomycetaceae bacterium]
MRDLAAYSNSSYAPGCGVVARVLWYYVSLVVFESGWLPSSALKRTVLRLFGASIGRGVVIKPNVRIKCPWRLTVGNEAWIGQDVWIDNIDDVTIEDSCCLSQGAYLCTGTHDHKSASFELMTAPIHIKSGAWVAAKAILLPGAIVEAGQVISAGSVHKRAEGVSLKRYGPQGKRR